MPMDVGFHLSSEEHAAAELVAVAQRVEELGFGSCSISDHFHPSADRQGHSPFVWSTLGALSQATDSLRLTTLVTCPLFRMHPVTVAHAAATTATMMPGRFALGLGAGERLNEHVTGLRWPRGAIRLRMLEEAVAIIRRLWSGELVSYDGDFFQVEEARLYDIPAEPPPILVAAGGPRAVDLAARIGDGMVLTSPDGDAVERFRQGGGQAKPVVGMGHVCVADSVEEAAKVVNEWWPHAALSSAVNAELPLPRYFEAAARSVPDGAVLDEIVLGPDPKHHLQRWRQYAHAGFDQAWVHQIGPDQERAARFYALEVLPDPEPNAPGLTIS
jgi:coenzyme F420-dependent glucose-6-phosphate dehydrogenase